MGFGLTLSMGCLVLLALAHSGLGEAKVIGPLLASPTLPPMGVPLPFARRVLRLAWHLTSVTWLALAAALIVSERTAPVVAAVLGVSGLALLVGTRGAHFAWALFVAGALGALHAFAPGSGREPVALLGAVVLAALGALHVAWALGWKGGLDVAVPSVDGAPAFKPGRLMTLLVACGLFGLAALLLVLAGLAPEVPASRALGLAAFAVFAARTVGNFGTVGLFKRVHGTAFARQDTALYTPLCFALAAAFLWVRD
ncbi:MAG: DUF3995 domain-containing protein [Archangium sp.]